MVSVAQPKLEIILEEKGDFHIKGNSKYKVWPTKVALAAVSRIASMLWKISTPRTWPWLGPRPP